MDEILQPFFTESEVAGQNPLPSPGSAPNLRPWQDIRVPVTRREVRRPPPPGRPRRRPRLPADLEAFLARWSPSGGGERSNYQLFLTELCAVLDLPKPNPSVPDDSKNAYVFDRSIPRQEADGSTTPNFIDLYKRGCFVCETKQGVERDQGEPALGARPKLKTGHGIRGTGTWDTAMEKARNQAEQYARALPASEGRPPFLLVVDVGYSIELFAEFTCTGGTYVRFPDPTAKTSPGRERKPPPGARKPSRRSGSSTAGSAGCGCWIPPVAAPISFT